MSISQKEENASQSRSFIANFFKSCFSIRTVALLIIYSFIIVLSLFLSYLLRFDFDLEKVDEHISIGIFYIIVSIKIIVLAIFRQFKSLLSFFHIPDLLSIFWAITISELLLFGMGSTMLGLGLTAIPRGVMLGDYILSVILFSTFRLSIRMIRERMFKDKDSSQGKTKRALIFGAGDIGTSLASDLMSRKSLKIQPVVFIDDDPAKCGKEIMGLEVLNASGNLERIVESYNIDRAIIATARISGARIGEIMGQFKKIGIESSIVPSYYDLASGHAKVMNMREVDIEDILGRESVKLDSELIGDMIKNKVVVVTGAGGSIGGELCRQIALKSPELLILIEHCEVQMFQIEQNLLSLETGVRIKCCVGSVTDEKRMDKIIKKYSPDIIFHAAAHKHVPMMESQPSEALKNNSLGTWIMAGVASKNKVPKFLLISTDKAINPTNVMGASKRLAEKAILSMQNRPNNITKFVAVRFGNVLGSSGSVIPTFKKQIAQGGPVTVTHVDVTRYFMTIPEAVGLVLQCGAQAQGGEIFVLNMGEPVKVINLARQMIKLSGFEPDIDIQIKIVGLRPGEKLYEELQHTDEHLVKTGHPRIFGFMSDAPAPSYEEMKVVADEIAATSDFQSVNDLKMYIHSLVPEYKAQFYD